MNIMDNIVCTFVCAEFMIGIIVTIRFVLKKWVLPAINFLNEFFDSYEEFVEWRKNNGKHREKRASGASGKP